MTSSAKKKNKSISFTQGQLTGLPRQIKDSVADIYSNIQKWKSLNAQGFNQLSKVSDLKLSLFVPIEPHECATQKKVYRYSDELDKACQSLLCTFTDLENILKNLSSITDKLSKLTDLDDYSSSMGDNVNKTVPFQMWSTSQFASHSEELLEMYSKELGVKRCIVEYAAHVDHMRDAQDLAALSEECRDILMSYSSCWLHQPYINENVRDKIIETMLLETGHSC